MANFTTVADLVEDALWLAGEPTSASGQFYTRATNLVSAMQHVLLTGGALGNIALPAMDWWWARKRANITVLPAINVPSASSATFTNASTTVNLGAAMSVDLDNYRLLIDEHRDQIPQVASHTVPNATCTIDLAWKPATLTTSTWRAVLLEYALATDFLRFAGPINVPDYPYQIGITDLATLQSRYPLPQLTAGTPELAAVCYQGTKVWFSHYYGDAKPRVFEYDYVYMPSALTVGGSDPVVPHAHRRVLSYGAALQLLFEKNDDKQGAMAGLFQAAWDAMEKVQVKDTARSPNHGRLVARPQQAQWNVLRTQTGVIIG